MSASALSSHESEAAIMSNNSRENELHVQQLSNSEHKNKKRSIKVTPIDESRQDGWIDRMRQNIHCGVLCRGSKCKHENWLAMSDVDKEEAAIKGLNSNWVSKNVIASQRLSTTLFAKYSIIQQFHMKNVTGVLNLQEKGEHALCGPNGVYIKTGYSYDGSEDLMPHGISYYEFPWPDMTAPHQDIVLRSVQVMDYHVKNKGKVLVHCHAGLGRTGLLIACYLVYSQHLPSASAIAKVRRARKKAIQTKRQAHFVTDFEKHLWRLSQAFRVEVSDAPMSNDFYIQQQRMVLHGEKADLYRWVPMFLHVILCRLLNLTYNDPEACVVALESLGPSSAPNFNILSAYRIAINCRQFKVNDITNVSVLSFLVCDWFRAMSEPILSIEDGDAIVEVQRTSFSKSESIQLPIRRILSKPARHTMGMVISALYCIAQQVKSRNVVRYAFRCLLDAFNHGFKPIRLRHSPIERELLLDFFIDWGVSIGDMYFNYDAVAPSHRTIKRIAQASSIVLKSTKVTAPAQADMSISTIFYTNNNNKKNNDIDSNNRSNLESIRNDVNINSDRDHHHHHHDYMDGNSVFNTDELSPLNEEHNNEELYGPYSPNVFTFPTSLLSQSSMSQESPTSSQIIVESTPSIKLNV